MDALDAIMTRRSVRRFSSEPDDDATVRALLGAAMQAPSAANEQPWRFVVIDERRALGRFREDRVHRKTWGG